MKYRIPKLEEFVQGFKFELAKDYSFLILDFTTTEKPEETKYREWVECEVWWKEDEDKLITQTYKNGDTFTFSGRTNNFFKPFNEESFLKQGLIRVKI